jgi:hypothetical protein
LDHVVKREQHWVEHYGSPTTSDKALMPLNLEDGQSDSARSHTADDLFISMK